MISFVPSEKFIIVWRSWAVLGISAAAFVCGIISVFSVLTAVIFGIVSLSAFMFIVLWYIPRYYRSYHITISDRAVAVSRGVFLRRKYVLPCPRLIYSERIVTPIDRIFSVQTIHIHAVRGRLRVHCLCPRDADMLMSLTGGEKGGDYNR